MDTDFPSQNPSLKESVTGCLFKQKSLAKKCLYLSRAYIYIYIFFFGKLGDPEKQLRYKKNTGIYKYLIHFMQEKNRRAGMCL